MKNKGYAVLDIETTGLDYRDNEMTQFAVVHLDLNGDYQGEFDSFVKIDRPEMPEKIVELTGITKADTDKGISKRKAKKKLKKLLKDRILVIQNAAFDLSYIETITGIGYDFIDIQNFSLHRDPSAKANLKAQAERFGFEFEHHKATEDALVTSKLFNQYMNSFEVKEFINYLIVRKSRPMRRIPLNAESIDVMVAGEFSSILRTGE